MFIRRQQYFIDRAVQGQLVMRTISQWFFCLVSISIMLLCWRMMTNPADNFSAHFGSLWNLIGPAFLAAMIVLPMVVIDVVKMSNRFVGPVFRLRSAMRQLAAGEEVRPVRFRDGDMWLELASDFNAVLARLAAAEGTTFASPEAIALGLDPVDGASVDGASAEESLLEEMESMTMPQDASDESPEPSAAL